MAIVVYAADVVAFAITALLAAAAVAVVPIT